MGSTAASGRIGVLLMAYGSPEDASGAESFFTHIRKGRRPSQEAIDDLRHRYEAIGGMSRFWEITSAQARRLEARLHETGLDARVYIGLKHWTPFIDDAVRRMIDDGVSHVVALVLAPQNADYSVGQYTHALTEALAAHRAPFGVTLLESWHDHPLLHQAFASRIRAALAGFGDQRPPVVFTAHSLPLRAIPPGDRYQDEFHATARFSALAAGLDKWEIAYQSAGMLPGEWLGPDVQARIEELYQQGHRSALVACVGFVCDHLEILYDLDVKLIGWARQRGMDVRRTASLNADPDFIDVLADLVMRSVPDGSREPWGPQRQLPAPVPA